MADQPARPQPGTEPPARARPDEEPVLPRITRDEQDVGWGDASDGGDEQRRRDDWLQRERPPHHEG